MLTVLTVKQLMNMILLVVVDPLVVLPTEYHQVVRIRPMVTDVSQDCT
jgi:hypothetical protein